MSRASETPSLNESEERFRATFEQAAVGIAHVAPQGRLLRLNQKFCDIVGYTHAELLGMMFQEITHPDDLASDLAQAARLLDGTISSYSMRKRYVRKDRSIVWVNLTTSLVRTPAGEPKYFIGVVEDITERRQAEENLRNSQQMLRNILDNFSGVVFWKDRNSVYLGCNRAFAIGAGLCEPSDIIGKTDYDLPWALFEADAYRADDRQMMESGQPKLGIVETQRQADGRLAWFETSKVPLFDAASAIIGVLGTSNDITERKQADEALKQAKEIAESASRAKDQFLSVLSHELRTPLTPVLATVSALSVKPDLSPELRGDMDLIRRNVELEVKLIDDLLDLTRLSRGKIQLHQEIVDAHVCLRRALEICQEEIESKHLDVSLSLHAASRHVWADPARLQQVFWNLIRNAVKFTPDKGRIGLHSTSQDGKLSIRITDSGIGIDPDLLPRLFNAFEQGEPARTRRFGGVGLGLTIARAIVEMHSGHLAAYSEGRGKGATFTLELATIPPLREQTAPPSASADGQISQRKILLVEDNADTLRVMSRLLRGCGYAVTPADCVHAALDRAAHETFDLLISDIGLPDGSGLDIMRHVKQRYGLRGIALSGYGADDDLQQSRAAGFEQHLTKPVSFNTLEVALRQIVP